MSLDLDKITVVDVTQCYGNYVGLQVDKWYGSDDLFGNSFDSKHLQHWLDYKVLTNLRSKYNQETGILPIQRQRIGRNCMNTQWHYNDMISSPNYRPECQDEDQDLDILFWERRLILPNEVEIKVIPHLTDDPDVDMDELSSGNYEFLFIGW